MAQPHRRIPFHVREQVEEKLRQLENEDIIECAEGLTPWVSPIDVVPKPQKPNEIRICVDMRSLNKAIIRERHVIPTIDDVVSDLIGCKVFSKIDLNQGYHQIPLHSDSRLLTTFSTHVGLFPYKRLNFGLSCAADIFQRKVSDAICGIPCAKKIKDDIHVGDIDNDTHVLHLKQVFHQLHENGLTINLTKCQFRVPRMLFFGDVFSGKGMSPDPRKVEALRRVAPPTNVSEVRSLLSFAAFCSRFIKDFAVITRPLRQLTCERVKMGEMSQPKKCHHYTMPVVRSLPLNQDIRRLTAKHCQFTGQSNVFTCLCMAKNSRSSPTTSLLLLCSTIHLLNYLQG